MTNDLIAKSGKTTTPKQLFSAIAFRSDGTGKSFHQIEGNKSFLHWLCCWCYCCWRCCLSSGNRFDTQAVGVSSVAVGELEPLPSSHTDGCEIDGLDWWAQRGWNHHGFPRNRAPKGLREGWLFSHFGDWLAKIRCCWTWRIMVRNYFFFPQKMRKFNLKAWHKPVICAMQHYPQDKMLAVLPLEEDTAASEPKGSFSPLLSKWFRLWCGFSGWTEFSHSRHPSKTEVGPETVVFVATNIWKQSVTYFEMGPGRPTISKEFIAMSLVNLRFLKSARLGYPAEETMTMWRKPPNDVVRECFVRFSNLAG